MSPAKRRLSGPVRTFMTSLRHSKAALCCGQYTINGFIQNGVRPPSWIRWAPIGTTHDEFLMVSIVVQNFVEIDAVVSIA